MALTLKAISYKGLPPQQEISARFDEQGGSIGRSPDNHLVLPDPEKFISRLHASIVFANGQYFIHDRSTGGTYLSRKDVLLQQTQIALEDGETVRIGEYELLVSIAGDSAAEFVAPVRQLDIAESSVLDDPFAVTPKSEPVGDFFSSFIEQPESSVIHQSFAMPEVAASPLPPAAVDDELDFSDLLSSLDALPGSSVPRPAMPTDMPELPDDFFADDVPEVRAQETATIDVEPSPVPVSEPWPEAAIPEPFAIASAPVAEAVFEPALPLRPAAQPVNPVPAHAPVGNPPIAAPAAEAHVPVSDDSALIREFLAGVGINDPNFLPSEQWPALMRTSGELLRAMVEGLMQVLRARAELKSQFRVAVTTMRSVDNNPLKFTPNPDDAIKLILAPTNPGFLAPKQAVGEGFNDIMNHQMAMTAGIQAALADVLRSFDPEVIEKSQTEGILFQKKAKCWEFYAEKYPQLKAVAQEEFFGDAFAEAYEKQMLLLSRAAKQP